MFDGVLLLNECITLFCPGMARYFCGFYQLNCRKAQNPISEYARGVRNVLWIRHLAVVNLAREGVFLRLMPLRKGLTFDLGNT